MSKPSETSGTPSGSLVVFRLAIPSEMLGARTEPRKMHRSRLSRPPRGGRRQAEAAAETAVEIRQIVKAALERDVGDAPPGGAQQKIDRHAQTQLQHPRDEGCAVLVQKLIHVA